MMLPKRGMFCALCNQSPLRWWFTHVEVLSQVELTALVCSNDFVGLIDKVGRYTNTCPTHRTDEERMRLNEIGVSRVRRYACRIQARGQHVGLRCRQMAGDYDQIALVCTVLRIRRLAHGQRELSISNFFFGNRLRLFGQITRRCPVDKLLVCELAKQGDEFWCAHGYVLSKVPTLNLRRSLETSKLNATHVRYKIYSIITIFYGG